VKGKRGNAGKNRKDLWGQVFLGMKTRMLSSYFDWKAILKISQVKSLKGSGTQSVGVPVALWLYWGKEIMNSKRGDPEGGGK